MFRFRIAPVSKAALPSLVAATASSFGTMARVATSSSSSSFNTIISGSNLFVAQRFCSSASGGAAAEISDSNNADAPPSEAEQLEQLLEECEMLLDAALPIGTLFKTLSGESRNFIAKQRSSLEATLLKYPGRFSIFKNRGDRNIYVSKADMAPAVARHGREVSGTSAGQTTAPEHGAKTDRAKARIYTVLRYIPDSWASYTALNIPEEVKNKIISPVKKGAGGKMMHHKGRKKQSALAWFNSHPRYFEVKHDPAHGHTFLVRRSAALQAFMASKKQAAEAEQRASARAALQSGGGEGGGGSGGAEFAAEDAAAPQEGLSQPPPASQ